MDNPSCTSSCVSPVFFLKDEEDHQLKLLDLGARELGKAAFHPY